ncbi:MAG: hypothetical protein WDA24_10585 [Tissierellales bacterium]
MTMKATVVDLNENFGVWFRTDGYPSGYPKCIGERLKRELSLRKVLDDILAEKDEVGNFIYDENDYVILNAKEISLIKDGKLQEFYTKTNLDYGYVYFLENSEIRLLEG